MDCVQGSICFEMAKGIPAAIVTFFIGCIAARITYNQFMVAKAKLKLDLFEKRYAIFHQTWVILSDVVIRGTREDHHGMATPFNNFLPEAAFLFGPEIYNYLDEVSTKWTELHGVEGDKDNVAAGLIKDDLELWFFNQASKGAKEKFSKYIDFQNWM
jgi:hypothetical protein